MPVGEDQSAFYRDAVRLCRLRLGRFGIRQAESAGGIRYKWVADTQGVYPSGRCPGWFLGTLAFPPCEDGIGLGKIRVEIYDFGKFSGRNRTFAYGHLAEVEVPGPGEFVLGV